MSSLYQRNGVYYYKGSGLRFSLKTRVQKEAKRLQKDYDRKIALEQARGDVSTSMKQVSFKDAKSEYLRYKKQNFAYRTYQTDKQRLDWFYDFTGNIRLIKITHKMIIDYVEFRSQSVKPSTIRITLIVVKAFLNYCRKRRYISSNPFEMYPIARGVIKPDYLSMDQVNELKSYTHPNRPYITSLLNLALQTGFRRGELVTLQWENINRHTIIVNGKAGKREFPITSKVRKILDNIPRQSKWVFPKPGNPSKHLDQDTASMAVKKAFANLKFPESYSLHTLRHTYASHLAMQGVPMQKIGVLLGHKQFETTLIYAHLQPKDLNTIEPDY